MARLKAKQVQITLENGKVLDFNTNLDDTVIVDEINTQETGTSAASPITIRYYVVRVVPAGEGTKG